MFIPLVQWLLNHWGWREALMALAAVNVLVCQHVLFTYHPRVTCESPPAT